MLAVGLILIIGLAILVYSKKSKYDEIVYPFFDEVMPVLAQWDHRSFHKYWAPEVAEKVSDADLMKLFGMFQRLGDLERFGEPQFLQVGSNTDIPYSSYVTYQFRGDFENGEAMLSWILVPGESGSMKIWKLNINSDVFIVPVEAETTNGP